jgi:hypothetical protein
VCARFYIQSQGLANEKGEMIDIFKQNEVLWRAIHCDYHKPGPHGIRY